MEEMSEQDYQAGDVRPAGRRRVAKGVFHVFGLLGGLFWLLIFLTVLRTGYLSWIGVVVGVFLTVPGTIGPVAGLAGRKHLEKLLSWIWVGTVISIVVTAVAVLIWPESGGVWRAYRFDDDLAAIEAERAVPDTDNAALRYESALATLDINDRPDFVFDRDLFLRKELSKDPWKAEDHPQASEWLDSHAEIVRGLLQVGELEKCRWPVLADDGGPYTVPHRRLLRGVQLLLATANRDLGAGHVAQAIEKYLCLLRQGDHLYQQTDQIDFMYGRHPEGAALHMIRFMLVGGELSREDIERIARGLPTVANTWRRDISNLVEFDKVRFARLMAWAYEINEQGKIRFAASFQPLTKKGQESSSRLRRLWRLYWLMNMPLDPHGVWAMAEQEAAHAARLLDLGPLLPRDTEFMPSFWSYLGFAGRILGSVPHFYAHTMCVSKDRYTVFGWNYAEHMTVRRGTWLVLGLRRYRDAHGVWPDALESLSEYVPSEAFLDPMSGSGYVYASDGSSFRLYSKGRNRIDEGGRHGYVRTLKKVEDDIWIWPPPAPKPPEDELTDDEMRKQMEQIYGREYVETYMKKDKGSDKR